MRDLRRYMPPIIVQNAEQVNVGSQRVNVLHKSQRDKEIDASKTVDQEIAIISKPTNRQSKRLLSGSKSADQRDAQNKDLICKLKRRRSGKRNVT